MTVGKMKRAGFLARLTDQNLRIRKTPGQRVRRHGGTAEGLILEVDPAGPGVRMAHVRWDDGTVSWWVLNDLKTSKLALPTQVRRTRT